MPGIWPVLRAGTRKAMLAKAMEAIAAKLS